MTIDKDPKSLSFGIDIGVTLDLTDHEWMLLLDGEDPDSELGSCCANVSALRDQFVSIVRQGRKSRLYNWETDPLMKALKWFADGHELTPVLKKVCEQLRFDPASITHEPSGYREHDPRR